MDAIQEAVKQLGFPPEVEIVLEIPRDEQHGDLATNVAMRLASKLKENPLSIAEKIAGELRRGGVTLSLHPYVSKVEAKAPGFVNFSLNPQILYQGIPEILREKERYGSSDFGKTEPVLLEFVSANPTGALSVAHGRQGAVGDSLANIMEFTGFKVSREYYLNNVGNQMNLLAQTIFVRYRELSGENLTLPEGGYKGTYIIDIARNILEKEGDRWKEWNPQTKERFLATGVAAILKGIKDDLEFFGVHFDSWFSQEELERSGSVQRILEQLKKKGFVYEQEGALWFKSATFGDDKNRVVVKSDGSFTYLAPDIAYHQNKLARGYKKLINLWGPDHHGYIPRLRAAVQSLGYPAQTLVVLIVQLTTLYEGERQLKMSTREGEFISLRKVMDAVGKDVARFFFLMRKVDSHLDFDLDLAKEQSMENPVYYIQYAHARICSILEFAEEEAFPRRAWDSDVIAGNLDLLTTPEEIKLLKVLRQFPSVVKMCAQLYEPYYLIPYLQKLAESFHQFYHQNRVISDDVALSRARLALAEAARIVIANGLRLLGVSAAEKM
jgi:arginyl-tRNA synthetase